MQAKFVKERPGFYFNSNDWATSNYRNTKTRNRQINLSSNTFLYSYVLLLFIIAYSKLYSQTNHLLDTKRWDEDQSVVSDEQ